MDIKALINCSKEIQNVIDELNGESKNFTIGFICAADDGTIPEIVPSV